MQLKIIIQKHFSIIIDTFVDTFMIYLWIYDTCLRNKEHQKVAYILLFVKDLERSLSVKY